MLWHYFNILCYCVNIPHIPQLLFTQWFLAFIAWMLLFIPHNLLIFFYKEMLPFPQPPSWTHRMKKFNMLKSVNTFLLMLKLSKLFSAQQCSGKCWGKSDIENDEKLGGAYEFTELAVLSGSQQPKLSENSSVYIFDQQWMTCH